jgi:D-glycero-D-manno-heptose 1,7-bisphosphate phosphatase
MDRKYRLVIFDVDGTLVQTKSGNVFRQSADDWKMIPGRIEKCVELRDGGAMIAIATNQAGVAFEWSRFTETEIQVEMDTLAIVINAAYVGVCYTSTNEKALPEYYNPNNPRRKPGSGMLLEAMSHCGVKPEDTVMVGDRKEDEEAAKAAGVTFVRIDQFFPARTSDNDWLDNE